MLLVSVIVAAAYGFEDHLGFKDHLGLIQGRVAYKEDEEETCLRWTLHKGMDCAKFDGKEVTLTFTPQGSEYSMAQTNEPQMHVHWRMDQPSEYPFRIGYVSGEADLAFSNGIGAIFHPKGQIDKVYHGEITEKYKDLTWKAGTEYDLYMTEHANVALNPPALLCPGHLGQLKQGVKYNVTIWIMDDHTSLQGVRVKAST